MVGISVRLHLEVMAMSVLDSSNINTTPGSNHASPFSPPKGWKGTGKEYVELLKTRYRQIGFYQRLYSTANFARKGHSINVVGPYATEAKIIIEAMKNNL